MKSKNTDGNIGLITNVGQKCFLKLKNEQGAF
jgi:hypothetical protein